MGRLPATACSYEHEGSSCFVSQPWKIRKPFFSYMVPRFHHYLNHESGTVKATIFGSWPIPSGLLAAVFAEFERVLERFGVSSGSGSVEDGFESAGVACVLPISTPLVR